MAAAVLLSASSAGAVPLELGVRGLLYGPAGPLNGSLAITLSLTDGGTPLWLETQIGVNFSDGRFAATIGSDKSGNPLPLSAFTGSSPLHFQISGQGLPGFSSLQLHSVAYALAAVHADTVDGHHVSQTPAPGAVLVLDGSGRLPTSALGAAALATAADGWDTDASDDLAPSTELGGDLSGTFDSLVLGSAVVDSATLADGGVGVDDLAPPIVSLLRSTVALNRNPDFEDGLAGWVDHPSATVSGIVDVTTANSGANSLLVSAATPADISAVAMAESHPVVGGSQLLVRFWYQRTDLSQAGGVEPPRMVLRFFDGGGSEVGTPMIFAFPDGADPDFVAASLGGGVPDDARAARVTFLGVGAGNVGSVHVDDFALMASALSMDTFVRSSGGTFEGDVEVAGALTVGGVTGGVVPSGALLFFDLEQCPSGWTPVAAAGGRTLMGMPAAGTLAGAVGTPLADLGSRTITQVPAHTHVIDPSSTVTSSGGAHTHGVDKADCVAGAGAGPSPVANCGASASNEANVAGVLSTAGSHAHTVDVPSFASDVTGEASVDVTMPYLQLLACKKN